MSGIRESEFKMRDIVKIAQNTIDIEQRSVRDRLDKAEQSVRKQLNNLEDRLESRVRWGVLFIGLVGAAIFGFGSITAAQNAREKANDAIIVLQKDIIAAQSTIRTAVDELEKAKTKLSATNVELQAKTTELGNATNAFRKAEAKYNDLVDKLKSDQAAN